MNECCYENKLNNKTLRKCCNAKTLLGKFYYEFYEDIV